jgi:hypothetical protein
METDLQFGENSSAPPRGLESVVKGIRMEVVAEESWGDRRNLCEKKFSQFFFVTY